MSLVIVKYKEKYRDEWDSFVEKGKNSTFLFKRDFIEYHGDRIIDHSVLVFYKKKLVGLMAGNLINNTLVSHYGLSYGGIIVQSDIKLNLYLLIFKKILQYLEANNIEYLEYKSIPIFYTSLKTQEEEYTMFLLNAENYRTDTSITIKYENILPIQTRRLRSIKKADKIGFQVKQDNNYHEFWEKILVPNLCKKFNKTPTHNLEEIEYLASKFPDNILQYNIYKDGVIAAGCTIFETDLVAHAQYISSNDLGRSGGAIDKLFGYLVRERYNNKTFFDFGICNENNGFSLNHGLLDWKEGFGGRTYVNKFYKVKVSNHYLLDKVLK